MASIDDGFYMWNKGEKEKIGVNFNTSEFSCQCSFDDCIEQMVDVELIKRLDNLRGNAKFPIIITSGYRCARHQKELSETPGIETAVGTSSHEMGQAADIKCKSLNMHELVEKAEPFFNSIGVGRSFVHLDLRDDKKRRWSYNY